MSYLVVGSRIRIINDEHISLVNDLPIGIYRYFFDPKEGSWIEPYKYNTDHTKIYGDAGKIANHIIKRYELNESRDNLGVLLSGGKGLGKSLTLRLVVEKLKSTRPVIIVDTFTPDLANFLSNISDCVIIMDEFDKFMKGPTVSRDNDDDDSDEMTKQEALLSTLDGVGNKLNNLYLLTCNNVSKIDTNFISRPGRIKYHYTFTSISEQAIRSYCKDNLDDKSQIDEIVAALKKFIYISFDILRALVEELNLFDVSVADALTYLNIAKPIRDVMVIVTYDSYNERDIKSHMDDDEDDYPPDEYELIEDGPRKTKKSKKAECVELTCRHTFYDIDLQAAISYNIGRNTYYIDLDNVDLSTRSAFVPLENIVEDEMNDDTIKIKSVRVTTIGTADIFGKAERGPNW